MASASLRAPRNGGSAPSPNHPRSKPRGLRSLPPLPAGGDVLCNTRFHFREVHAAVLVSTTRVTFCPSQPCPRTPGLGQPLWLLNPWSGIVKSCLVFFFFLQGPNTQTHQWVPQTPSAQPSCLTQVSYNGHSPAATGVLCPPWSPLPVSVACPFRRPLG